MEVHKSKSAEKFLGTVLVTGGCGFVGSFITEAFAAEPSCDRVVVASRNPNKYRVPQVDYHSCDFTDVSQVENLLDAVKPRVIVHTVSPGPFALPSKQYKVSYQGTKTLLEIAKRHTAIRAFVWTSSGNAVNLRPEMNHQPSNEIEAEVNDWKSPASAYSCAKGATETFVLGSNTDATTVDFSENADWHMKLVTTSIRITGLYGPRDMTTVGQMISLVNKFAARIQIGPNRLQHSWCYAENAGHAHLIAAKALLDGKHLHPDMRVDGEAFFIADPTPMKMWDFERKLLQIAGDQFCNKPTDQQRLIVIPFGVMMMIAWISEWLYWVFTLGSKRPLMTMDHFEIMSRGYWFSIEKAKKRLGYVPVCDTEEGLRRSVEWFRDNKR